MSGVDKGIAAQNASWTFDDIADRFEEHVAKSVPSYHEGHQLICRLSDFFLTSNSVVYDIGCSTGLLTRRILDWHKTRDSLRVIGVDPVPSMVEHAGKAAAGDPRVSYACDDVVTMEMGPCSLVTAYYTIQFIHPHFRQQVFDKIYQSLNWGGALLIFEKVRGPDARFQDYLTQVYHDFKLDQGFSEAEVVHKSRSLKGVLEPFSTQGNLDLMRRAGFTDIVTVFKWVCFEGWLAIK